MKTHKFVNDPTELLKQGSEIVSQNADNKFVHRVSMVNLMLGGFPAKTLSFYCGDSERTLQTWVKNVDEKGWNSLVSVKQSGRPRILSKEQIKEIKEAILKGVEESGYDVWDGPTLSGYIKKTYDIDYGVRACQNLMHEMGLSLVRPQMYPSLDNPDEEAREDLKKNHRSSKRPKHNSSLPG